jgi:hypothetical protein
MLASFIYYAALVFEGIIGVFGVRLYEEPGYEVLGRVADRVEIRRYGPRVAAEVEMPDSGGSGREQAFRLLFAYIAGANQLATDASAKMAMTAPVEVRGPQRLAMTVPVQTAADASGALRMRFFLPAKYSADTAPRPRDSRVQIVTIPEETVATLRFSGTGADFGERQSELIRLLAESPWQPTSAPYALNYDAPFTLPFMRRNEAAVAVVKR